MNPSLGHRTWHLLRLLVMLHISESGACSEECKDLPAQEQSNSYFNKALLVFVPFMVGWFALALPAGLGLYYFSNTIITSGIQIWLRKLGGAPFSLPCMWLTKPCGHACTRLSGSLRKEGLGFRLVQCII